MERGSKPQFQKINIPLDNIQIDHESKSLLSFINDYIKDINIICKMLETKKYLNLTYEDDIEEDPMNAYEKICDFIGVKKLKPIISLAKTTPFPIKDLVSNYDEVANYLKFSSHEWMLEN